MSNMKKANKQAAREWKQEQGAAVRVKEIISEQKELLYYVACRRKSGFPNVESLTRADMLDVADKVQEAYNLLNQAYSLAEKYSGAEE